MTYVVNPTMDFPKDGTVADHAYWLSGMKLGNAGGAAPLGTIDARSEGFGTGDPPQHAVSHTLGTLTGGNVAPLEYAETSRTWGKAPKRPVRNVLHLDATNLRTVTVNPGRARLTCGAGLDVHTNGPLAVKLAGCGRTEHFGN